MTPWLTRALSLYGEREVIGHDDNPEIVRWFRYVDLPERAHRDATAHCSVFVNMCLQESGYPGTRSAVARSWLQYGESVPFDEAELGDICVFSRGEPWTGHVAFWVRRAGQHIHVLGANQGNQVCVKPYPAARLLAVRRPNPLDASTV